MEFIYISLSVLKWRGEVYNGICLAGSVDCDVVRSQRPIKARHRLVDCIAGGGRNIKRPRQSVLDGTVALCYGHEIWFAIV